MIEPTQLSRWIYENNSIWQNDLLNPRAISSFIRNRKVDFWEDQIVHLWQLGWVRAEIIKGAGSLVVEGIDLLEKNDQDSSLYADNRKLGSIQINSKAPIKQLVEKNTAFVPYFHPFKYFAFWCINQKLKLIICPYQMMNPSNYHERLDQNIDIFYQWAQGENAKKQINHWDEIIRLAIATEPCFYPQIIGTLRYPPQVSLEEMTAKTQTYKTQLKSYYLAIGIEPIKEIVRELCISAESIDPNSDIHSLMRFIKGKQRINTKGNLGGAILLKSMAETIRRMAEFSFGVQLPEEDEMGFGMWVEGAKEQVYSTKRIFDSGSNAKRLFTREIGLDTEVRVRIYVEGQTELAAFNYLLNFWDRIEVINLRGHFVQGLGKGLAFRDNLILDDRAGVFSVIILDGDVGDNINAVRQAAKDDLFCGFFYVSRPDFEFCNFSKEEMIEIIWGLVDEVQKSEQNYSLLCEVIKNAINAKELFNEVRRSIPSLSQIAKGRGLGERLAEYATRNPKLKGSETDRPFIDACKTAIRSITANYQETRKKFRVDPNTGKLIRR